MEQKKMTAIVCVEAANLKREFKKYRNVLDKPRPVKRFCHFITTQFPGARHVNFYDATTKEFIRQEKFSNGN